MEIHTCELYVLDVCQDRLGWPLFHSAPVLHSPSRNSHAISLSSSAPPSPPPPPIVQLSAAKPTQNPPLLPMFLSASSFSLMVFGLKRKLKRLFADRTKKGTFSLSPLFPLSLSLTPLLLPVRWL